jgi:S1-C subfamily serine protease
MTDDERADRNRRIIRDRLRGLSLRAIGSAYGVTAERVSQIVSAANAGVQARGPGGGHNKVIKWDAPLRPQRTWRREIAERLRELRERGR